MMRWRMRRPSTTVPGARATSRRVRGAGRRLRGGRRGRQAVMVTLMLAMFAALAAPAQAKPRGKFDTSEGFYDPRRPDLPRTHRFRLSIESGYIGLSTVLDNSTCLLYTSPSPRDLSTSRMPSSA